MITTSDRFVIYDISGGAVAQYAFTFPYADEADMKAYAVTSAGVQQPLVNPTDFTISGQVWNRVADLSAYVTLVIYRETPMTQPQDFRNGDAFLGPLLTDALDRATMQLQESREEASRSVAVPLTDPAITEIPPVGTRANMVFTWDEDGNPSVGGGYARVSPALLPFVTAADITAAQKALGLLPSGASSPIPAASQAFIADPSAENIPVGTNRFGATDLQGLLDVAVGTMYEHVPTPGATKEVNGWTRILYSGSGGSITITNGASLEPGDILIIANTGAGDYDVTINGAVYELPSGCAEVWVYEPGVDSDAPWMSTILQPRRSDMSAAPSDDELVTVEYVRRHLAFYLLREFAVSTTSLASGDYYASCWDGYNKRFALVASGFSASYYSPDGLVWTAATMPAGTSWYDMAYSPSLHRIVAVSFSANFAYSNNGGETWAAASTPPSSRSWRRVIWVEELGEFFAIAESSNYLARSSDGITWSEAAVMPASRSWYDIQWSSRLGLLVAIADGVGVSTSPDGTTWTDRTMQNPTNTWRSVVDAPGLGLLFAFGGTTIETSPNGIDWSVLSAPAELTTAPFHPVWIDEAQALVLAIPGNVIYTQKLGTWRVCPQNLSAYTIRHPIWAPEIGRLLLTQISSAQITLASTNSI